MGLPRVVPGSSPGVGNKGVFSGEKVFCFGRVRCPIHRRKSKASGSIPDTSTQTTATQMVNGGPPKGTGC